MRALPGLSDMVPDDRAKDRCCDQISHANCLHGIASCSEPYRRFREAVRWRTTGVIFQQLSGEKG